MKAIITGSFDPITVGHVEIVKKALKFFDKIYVVALLNENKNYMFSLEEKKEIMSLALQKFDNVIVDAYSGLTVDYMHNHKINKIVRGIRGKDDEEYEKKLADAMSSYDINFETIFIECEEKFKHISSTYARKAIENEKDLNGIIPENAIGKVKEIYNSKKK